MKTRVQTLNSPLDQIWEDDLSDHITSNTLEIIIQSPKISRLLEAGLIA